MQDCHNFSVPLFCQTVSKFQTVPIASVELQLSVIKTRVVRKK